MTSVWVIVAIYMQEAVGKERAARAVGGPAALLSAYAANWAGKRVHRGAAYRDRRYLAGHRGHGAECAGDFICKAQALLACGGWWRACLWWAWRKVR